MPQKSVKLNEDHCRAVGQTVAKYKLRNDFYDRKFLTAKLDGETKLRMHFFAVAICHQTHTLHHPGLNLWGWDYLEHAFIEIAENHKEIINPAFLISLSVNKLSALLRPYFSPDGKSENCTLDRLDERSALMIEASVFISKNYHGKIAELMGISEQRLYNNGKGLYETLKDMEAFSDPLQKKSTFLIKLLEEGGLIKIQDHENFIPIMDYHMQRVLMRLGCVEIIDPELYRQLVNKKTVESDEDIRTACIEAFKIIAKVSGHPTTKMNDFFWSLGRSCCNKTTLCKDGFCDKNPCTFMQIVDIEYHNYCIFEETCKGFHDDKYRNLWQPIIETHFY